MDKRLNQSDQNLESYTRNDLVRFILRHPLFFDEWTKVLDTLIGQLDLPVQDPGTSISSEISRDTTA